MLPGAGGAGRETHPGDDGGVDAAIAEPGDELRERLLAAAATVFARQGYEGTRIMDIVREAGLSTGAVYARFRSKNELLREAVISRAGRVATMGPGPAGRVIDLAARFLLDPASPLSDDEAVRLEAFVAARREPEVAEALAEATQVTRLALEPLVETARRDGTLADDVDTEAAIFLIRILNLGLVLHRGAGLPTPEPGAWRALLTRILASFGAASGADALVGDPTSGGSKPSRTHERQSP